MIYHATEWFEIVQYNDANTDTIENLVYKTRPCTYRKTKIIMYNLRNAYLVHASKNYVIQKYYGIKPKCANT